MGSRDSLKCCEFSKNSKKSFFTFFLGQLGSRDSLKGDQGQPKMLRIFQKF
ncbi:hypothetical protein T11_9314 [Trichinella zimbabwensis]|uniref:Uncharacterized protein n=1 Tax=Trichinella zimbabwensis TaxID=268475 RepID=A0A0V1F361_9BILA|nr:hypothetical protein T11_9314 [Trichinella zimbabwensis]